LRECAFSSLSSTKSPTPSASRSGIFDIPPDHHKRFLSEKHASDQSLRVLKNQRTFYPIIPATKPRIEDAIAIAKTLNREAALTVLARFNIDSCLATIGGNPSIRSDVQSKIISQTISERRRQELAEKLQGSKLHERPLVHRAQLLVAMKLVMAFGKDSGGNKLERRDDLDNLAVKRYRFISGVARRAKRLSYILHPGHGMDQVRP
jgi:hypothetical protein